MTFRTFDGSSLVLAAVLGAAACSSRTAGTGAAPAASPAADSGRDSAVATAPASPSPADSGRDSTVATAPASPSPADSAGQRPADTAATSAARDSTQPASEMNPAPAGASDSGFVQYDPSTKTVTFRLVAGPFTFDGYSKGGATLTIPPGTTNVWNFEQGDGTPHSAEVATGEGAVPNSGGNPAIPRAYTTKVVEGLAQGGTDVIRFTAPAQGTFRIICGVPGHAVGGMWLWLKIDPSAKAPTFAATPQ
jgi:hypothetical protein